MSSNRPRIFYGWWIILVSVAGELFGAPVSVYSFGIFLKPLVHDFHASRAAISFAFTLHNVIGALLLPAMGRLIDRVGARRVILALTAVFALALLSALGIGQGIWQLYVFYTALGVTLGAGPGPLSYGVVISHWFNRRRGLALGLVGLGIGIGAFAVPLMSQRLITNFGWRAAYAVFGGAMLLISIPVVAIFLQNDPSDRGLQADNAEPAMEATANKEGLRWADIRRSADFWLMIVVFTLTSASMHAGVLHMPALLTDRGVSAGRAAMASAVIGISLIVGRLGSGYLLDRFFAPRIAMLFYGACAIGLGILWSGEARSSAMLAAFLVGLGMGSEVELMAYLVSRYFGLRSFATAYGYAFAAFMLAGAAGTLLMGAAYDHFHSYSVPLGCSCVAVICAVVLLARLGPYRYGVESEPKLPLEAVPAVIGA
ncbi:MAG: MFS transporter [Acidobacteriaceae bacterium]